LENNFSKLDNFFSKLERAIFQLGKVQFPSWKIQNAGASVSFCAGIRLEQRRKMQRTLLDPTRIGFVRRFRSVRRTGQTVVNQPSDADQCDARCMISPNSWAHPTRIYAVGESKAVHYNGIPLQRPRCTALIPVLHRRTAFRFVVVHLRG
jgi:hypothetical protein